MNLGEYKMQIIIVAIFLFGCSHLPPRNPSGVSFPVYCDGDNQTVQSGEAYELSRDIHIGETPSGQSLCIETKSNGSVKVCFFPADKYQRQVHLVAPIFFEVKNVSPNNTELKGSIGSSAIHATVVCRNSDTYQMMCPIGSLSPFFKQTKRGDCTPRQNSPEEATKTSP